jgi:hypothetical protein
MAKDTNILEFLDTVKETSNLPTPLKEQAEALHAEITKRSVLETDLWIYRAVVVILGTAVVATIFGGLALAFYGNATNYKLPAEIVAIGSAAVGALAGLLAPSPKDKQ